MERNSEPRASRSVKGAVLSGVDRETICWFLIVPYVLIDALNGFLLQGLGLPVRLSVMAKLTLSAMCGIVVASRTPLAMVPIGMLGMVLLFTPLRNLIDHGPAFVVFDLSVALRLLALAVFGVFVYGSARRNPGRFERNAARTLILGFWVVSLNVLSGHLGLGYPTYESTGIGLKGFFIAGNELGALFIVLGSFVLYRQWQADRLLRYAMTSLLVLVVGLSIATKTAIAFGLLGGLAIPWLRSPSKVIRPRSLAFLVAALSIPLGVGVLAWDSIAEANVTEQMRYIYESLGLERLLLSGRNVAAEAYFERASTEGSALPFLVGYGSKTVDLGTAEMVEMDPIDMMLLFGWPLTLVAVTAALASVLIPLRYARNRFHAPLATFVNGVLLGVALIAGHVWTSSTVGLSWALLNGLVITDARRGVWEENTRSTL